MTSDVPVLACLGFLWCCILYIYIIDMFCVCIAFLITLFVYKKVFLVNIIYMNVSKTCSPLPMLLYIKVSCVCQFSDFV